MTSRGEPIATIHVVEMSKVQEQMCPGRKGEGLSYKGCKVALKNGVESLTSRDD